jgi:hypothetical protein
VGCLFSPNGRQPDTSHDPAGWLEALAESEAQLAAGLIVPGELSGSVCMARWFGLRPGRPPPTTQCPGSRTTESPNGAGFSISGVPEKRHTVGGKRAVGRDEREVLGQCLGDQHPVERIAMMAWQPAGRDPVGWLDRQHLEPQPFDHLVEQIEREFQVAERVLDRNFPWRDRTDQNLVFGRSQRNLYPSIEPGGFRDRPDKDVCIEQEVQRAYSSNARRKLSGRGSSK